MKASVTQIAVQRQLVAMGCDTYDIGILRSDARMLLREGRRARWIEHSLRWLKRENARGAHIFVRPHGEHRLTLIDDLDASAILELKHSGFRPAVVIETSVGNFQAWLKHGRVLSRTLEYSGSKGAGTSIRRRSFQCRLASLRSTCRLHQSEAAKASRQRVGALCQAPRMERPKLRQYRGISCRSIRQTAQKSRPSSIFDGETHESGVRVPSLPSHCFIAIIVIKTIFIGPTWPGRSMPSAEVSPSSKFTRRSSMPAISPRRVADDDSSTMRVGPLQKHWLWP